MGNPDMLTIKTLHTLEKAPVIAGEQRLLSHLPSSISAKKVSCDDYTQLPALFDQWYEHEQAHVIAQGQEKQQENVCGTAVPCAVFSGDTGFYSDASNIVPLLEQNGYQVTVIPGITTPQYLASKLRRSWNDWRIVCDTPSMQTLGAEIGRSRETLFFTGAELTPQSIIQFLVEHGAGNAMVTVAENLSYENEKITTARAIDFSMRLKAHTIDFSILSVLLVERNLPDGQFGTSKLQQTCGFPDDFFVRAAAGERNIPLTRQEERAVIMAKLALCDGEVFYDVGSGTGSISVEAALSCHCSVFAIEQNAAACALIQKNRAKAAASNIEIIQNSAPQAFATLPAPDAVFIGGSHNDSGANLSAIVSAVRKKNPRSRIIISALTLETLTLASNLAGKGVEAEILELSVNRTRKAGRVHVFSPLSPLFLVYLPPLI